MKQTMCISMFAIHVAVHKGCVFLTFCLHVTDRCRFNGLDGLDNRDLGLDSPGLGLGLSIPGLDNISVKMTSSFRVTNIKI